MDVCSTPTWVKRRVLGQGSYGVVFMASPIDDSTVDHAQAQDDRSLKKKKVIAVKSAYDHMMLESSLREEAEFLYELRGCPEIIRCFGDDISMENGDRVYNLLLEYAPGGTLLDLIQKRSMMSRRLIGAIPELEVSWYCYLLLLGLQHIHDSGYVHCDFKPENVLVFPTEDGTLNRVKIADLGLAKKAGCNTIRPILVNGTWYQHRGTPRYSSPESVLHGMHESPMDIWALGITVLEMLTGRSAYPDSSLEDLLLRICFDEELPELPDYNQIDISVYGMDFLRKCLIRDPMMRWTADQLLHHPFIVEHQKILRGLRLITEPKMLLENPVAPTSWWSGFSLFSDLRSVKL